MLIIRWMRNVQYDALNSSKGQYAKFVNEHPVWSAVKALK